MRHSWTRQIVTIENKGYSAFHEGKTEADCPYRGGHRNQNGVGGQFQILRRQAWLRGFRIAAKRDEESKP